MRNGTVSFLVREAMAELAIKAAVGDKWEAPNRNRKTWRRRNPDGSFEDRETPPDGKQPGAEESPQGKKTVTKEPDTKDKKKAPVMTSKHHVKLTRNELKHILSKGYFTTMSAGRNPADPKEKDMKPDDEFFQKRHEQLKKDLEEKGYDYTEAVGHYDGREDTFMVFHDGTELTPKTSKSVLVHHSDAKELRSRRNDLEELGKKFNQNSVLHGSAGKN